jgi:hypothetical protein
MSKHQIKSIFEQIAAQVFTLNDVKQAKAYIKHFISEKNIKEEDKKTILRNVDSCQSMYKVHNYICNSLLKYEGLSVNKDVKTTVATVECD